MFFRNSVTHERNLRFDEWQQTTDRALRRPDVQEELGQLGVRLIQLNRTAFLPNVRHAEVSVPQRYLKTGRVGILPYLAADNNLTPHSTLLQPTPARRRRVQETLGKTGNNNSRRAVNAFIDQAVTHITAKEKTNLVNPNRTVSGGMVYLYDTDTETLLTTRPLVVFRRPDIPRNRILRGAMGARELTRTVDAEELMQQPGPEYETRAALRGSRVGAVIAKSGMASSDLADWLYERDDSTTAKIEAIRQAHGIDSDALLNGGWQPTGANATPLEIEILGITAS